MKKILFAAIVLTLLSGCGPKTEPVDLSQDIGVYNISVKSPFL